MREHAALKVLLIVLIVVFLGHQLYSSLYKPITTQSAEYYEAVDGLKITGTIIRTENIITNESTGILHFITDDGSRVAKGGTVAAVYDSTDASIAIDRIEFLESQIKDIEEIQGYNDLQAADLELANSRVSNSLSTLVYNYSSGDFYNSLDDLNSLLSSINRRQLITGEQTDFSVRLAALKEELATLKTKLPTEKGSIKATQSGYFVSMIDGYENILKTSSLDDITPEFLKDLKPESSPSDVVGKIVSDYEWYIAARVSINDSLKYKVDDKLIIRTDIKTNPTLPVNVKQINISDSSDSAVIIFSCQQMSSELATMRTGSMTVVAKTFEGLKISRKSLRVVDGETGVYIVSGITLKFVPVNVIYTSEKEGFVICEQEQTTSDVLRLYDEVVVRGKKLYEGKNIG